MDGELWLGRGTSSQDVMSVVKSKGSSHKWSEIGYYLYDLPASRSPYNERIMELEQLKQFLPQHVHVVHNIRCKGTEHSKAHLEFMVSKEGEGLMVRDPNSLYIPGLITSSLLKVKVLYR